MPRYFIGTSISYTMCRISSESDCVSQIFYKEEPLEWDLSFPLLSHTHDAPIWTSCLWYTDGSPVAGLSQGQQQEERQMGHHLHSTFCHERQYLTIHFCLNSSPLYFIKPQGYHFDGNRSSRTSPGGAVAISVLSVICLALMAPSWIFSESWAMLTRDHLHKWFCGQWSVGSWSSWCQSPTVWHRRAEGHGAQLGEAEQAGTHQTWKSSAFGPHTLGWRF